MNMERQMLSIYSIKQKTLFQLYSLHVVFFLYYFVLFCMSICASVLYRLTQTSLKCQPNSNNTSKKVV